MERRKQLEELFGTISDSEEEEKTGPDKREGVKLPRPGTSVQRSDADQRRKAIWLASPPPIAPKRRRLTGTQARPPPPPATQARETRLATLARRAPPGRPTVAAISRPRSGSPESTTGAARIIRSALQAVTQQARPTAAETATTRATTPPAPTRPQPATSTTQATGSGDTVRVTLGDGHTVDVPLLAALRYRKYRAWSPTGRWIVRFDQRGQPRSVRRQERRHLPNEGE